MDALDSRFAEERLRQKRGVHQRKDELNKNEVRDDDDNNRQQRQVQQGRRARLGRYGNADIGQAIAQGERSAEHYNHGYRQYNEGGGGKGAFGRYQLRKGVLVEAGWMDKLGRWTEKAASNGVKNDVDVLDRPQAQEQAMSDVLRVYDRQARALGVDRYVGHYRLAVPSVARGNHCHGSSRRHNRRQKFLGTNGYRQESFQRRRCENWPVRCKTLTRIRRRRL
jgi:hypothetical protein